MNSKIKGEKKAREKNCSARNRA